MVKLQAGPVQMWFLLLLFDIVNRKYSLIVISMKSTASYIGFKERQNHLRGCLSMCLLR
jgi:hypothetical protein